MRTVIHITAWVLLLGACPGHAGWEPDPEQSEGIVERSTHYTDAIWFAVRGTGTYASGQVVTNGYYDYTFTGAERLRVSPGDHVRVICVVPQTSGVRVAEKVILLTDVSTGGVVVVESTMAEAGARASREYVREEFMSGAVILLPLIFLVLMAIGLALRLLAAFVLTSWDRRYFPRTIAPYLVLGLASLWLTYRVGRSLFREIEDIHYSGGLAHSAREASEKDETEVTEIGPSVCPLQWGRLLG